MRVYIRTGNKRLVIPLPLILVKFGLSLFNKPFIKKYVPEKERKYVDVIDFGQLSKCIGVLKDYRGLKIVEVKSKDGTEVVITL
ncbi:hypothetical protein ACFHWD_14955 [Clostridium sp. MT-14]|jgi:hypothetical protein|uniref:Uncharacterized protein n=1 Tax=Clostridium aromativorans TaxID=2836848 RepID=A0ABS8NAD5_9CLOT|nr:MULTISPECIES: hypothetical protein [Clostridium]KAA8666234.1 hypothetical protein F3O63_17150 [Clostridium sp. HV4-5-A1G]MCC9296114.1 hypothetical protein [Clostridium aromativorans]CAB1246329.1 conserved hypothetical protein [Clostridiaceae bacterium BL-3]